MKLTLKDYFNPSNIRNFVEGNYMMLKDRLSQKGIHEHWKEQAIYRAMLCKPCLVNGKCTECGCKTPNLFFSSQKVDSKNNWGKMLNVQDWEAFKKENDIGELPTSFELIKEIEHGRHTGQLRPEEELLGSEHGVSNSEGISTS
jgi:hypothetical protein